MQTEIAGAPVLVGNRLVALTRQGILVSSDLMGNKSWQRKLSGLCVASPALGPGGLIYAGTLVGNVEIYSLEGVKTGEISGDIPLRAPPLVDCDLIVLADSRGNVCAYERKSRKPVWKTALGNPVFAGPVFTVEGEILIPAKDHALFRLNRRGGIRWKFRTRGVNYSSPAVDSNGDILLTTMGRSLYRISPRGREIWRFDTSRWIASSPVIDWRGNTYFGCYDRHFYCVDNRGKLKWKVLCQGAVNASPVLDKAGVVYTGDSSGRFFAFHSENGSLAWQYKTADFLRSPLMLHPDRKLLAGGGLDSYLYVFRIGGSLDMRSAWPRYLGLRKTCATTH